MPSAHYTSPAALLADARLRLDKLKGPYGLLVVEGADETRFLARRCVNRLQVIPTGGRDLLLAAFQALRPGEERRIVFLADCDYDVPARKAVLGTANFVVTDNIDFDADVIGLGGLPSVLEEILPSDRYSGADYTAIAETALDRAIAFAELVGQLRALAATRQIHLSVNVSPRDYRDARSDRVAGDRLLRDVLRRSSRAQVNVDEVKEEISSYPSGLRICNGHDVHEALADVLERDFGVRRGALSTLPHMMRLACDERRVQEWNVVRRLRRWESSVGARVLL